MKQYFDFIDIKKYMFMFTGALFTFFIIMFFVNGLQLDIQFKGGTRYAFEATQDFDANKAGEVSQKVTGRLVTASITKTYNPESKAANLTMLRLDVAGNEPLSSDIETKLKTELAAQFPIKLDSNKNESASISPSIGAETLNMGVAAVAISCILILLYVAWRFTSLSGMAAAITAVIALLHDVGVMFGTYIVFQIPMNDVFIAAVLTIIGFSINDTIVVYDRIRENSFLMRKSTMKEIINTSLWQTMTRTINTSSTVLVAVLCIFLFSQFNGISSLRDFGLSMTTGAVSGVYSSLFVAVPLWYMIREKQMKKKVA